MIKLLDSIFCFRDLWALVGNNSTLQHVSQRSEQWQHSPGGKIICEQFFYLSSILLHNKRKMFSSVIPLKWERTSKVRQASVIAQQSELFIGLGFMETSLFQARWIIGKGVFMQSPSKSRSHQHGVCVSSALNNAMGFSSSVLQVNSFMISFHSKVPEHIWQWETWVLFSLKEFGEHAQTNKLVCLNF